MGLNFSKFLLYIQNRKPLKLEGFLLILLVIFLLPACNSVENTIGSTSYQVATATAVTSKTLPKDWQYRWLQSIPCAPPCWEGITPGKTTPEEAVKILKGNTLFINVTINSSPLVSNVRSVNWNWLNGDNGGDANFDARLLNIPLTAINPKYSISFDFKKIIEVFGYPSHVILTPSLNPDMDGPRFSYLLRIIYLKKGFLLNYISNVKPVLDEKLPLTDPQFFQPGIDNFDIIDIKERLVDWQGFVDFSLYCRDVNLNGKKPQRTDWCELASKENS